MIWVWSAPHRAPASFLLLLASMLCAAVAIAQPAGADNGDTLNANVPNSKSVSAVGPSLRLTVAVDSAVIKPGTKTFLEPNFPNPFSVRTSIGYTLGEETVVELKVYDFTYREVATLVKNERQQPGRYVVPFVPVGLSSAMYFYELRTSQGVEQRRMLYIK
jgi:hypothetical protein